MDGEIQWGARLKSDEELEERGREDAEVVHRVLSGDRESFRILVDKYERFAVGLAYGMVSNQDLASEVAQESMIKAYESLGKLQDPRRFHSWLFGIIKNTSLMILKKRRVRNSVSLDQLPGSMMDTKTQAADEKMMEEQKKQEVWKAINELGDKYRDVILLFHFYSKSYEEIGAVLGLEHKGVDSRLHRARIMLREKLKNLIKE